MVLVRDLRFGSISEIRSDLGDWIRSPGARSPWSLMVHMSAWLHVMVYMVQVAKGAISQANLDRLCPKVRSPPTFGSYRMPHKLASLNESHYAL